MKFKIIKLGNLILFSVLVIFAHYAEGHASEQKIYSSISATFTVCSKEAVKWGKCDFNCDGIEDQIEINQAIQSLPRRGGAIYLTEGQFTIGSPIIVNRGGIKIFGAGQDATAIYLKKEANSNIIELKSDIKDEWFTLEDVWLDGNKMGQSVQDLVGMLVRNETGRLGDVHLRNVFITRISGNGIELEEGWGAVFESITIEFVTGAGIVLHKGDDIKIVHSKIISNDGEAIHIKPGVRFAKIAMNQLDAGKDHFVLNVQGHGNIFSENLIREDKKEKSLGIRVDGFNNIFTSNVFHMVNKDSSFAMFTERSSGNIFKNNITYPFEKKKIVDKSGRNNISLPKHK